jgi:hypothetical protein
MTKVKKFVTWFRKRSGKRLLLSLGIFIATLHTIGQANYLFRDPGEPLEHPRGLLGDVCCHFFNLTFKEREFILNACPEHVPVYRKYRWVMISPYRIFRSSLYRESY